MTIVITIILFIGLAFRVLIKQRGFGKVCFLTLSIHSHLTDIFCNTFQNELYSILNCTLYEFVNLICTRNDKYHILLEHNIIFYRATFNVKY